jgi:hypothetical protein
VQRHETHIQRFLLVAITAMAGLSTVSCSNGELQGCAGPEISSSLLEVRKGNLPSGPKGYLVVPNPIDATGLASATATTSETLASAKMFSLSELTSASLLENAFLKVRIETMSDAVSTLARPNANGEFSYRVEDVHNWEVMAYQSITSLRRYVKALGFGLDESRPLYVTVRSKQAGVAADTVNAYYTHNYFDPTAPRTIKLFGRGNYAPGQDRFVYWHEFGHYLNESISKQVGMDYAGDSGAVYTEGSALHECLADYIAESTGNVSYIGKWIAPNFEGYNAGDPLRSAADVQGKKLTYSQVSLADGTGAKPERYAVAEWCTRVLWDIRKALVAESKDIGAVRSDLLMLSALSLLKKDASISGYRDAVAQADQQLFCGGHQAVINQAFENRGFVKSASLTNPLAITATIYGVTSTGATTSSISPGQDFTFRIRITNSNSQVARNVRIKLESTDARVRGTTYMQGLGDLAANRTLDIGSTSGLSFEYSVYGVVDSATPRGTKVPYTLRLMTENAADKILRGEIQL